MAADAATGINFTFACPAAVHYMNASNINQIDLPTGTGMMGILPQHVPSLGVLQAGWTTVYESSGDAKRFFVSSGSYSINEDALFRLPPRRPSLRLISTWRPPRKNWQLPSPKSAPVLRLKRLRLRSLLSASRLCSSKLPKSFI